MGVSDLRSIWRVRAGEITLGELIAFYDTIPPQSATMRKREGVVSGYDQGHLLMARLIDLTFAAAAGKKFKKKDALVQYLVEKSGENAKAEESAKAVDAWRSKTVSIPDWAKK